MPPPPSQPAPATVFGISVDWLADMQSWLDAVFGSSAELITWWQMSLRAVVILIYGILIFRFAYRRVFGQSTEFDIVAVVLIGSTLSRAVTGNAQLLPTIAAATVLIVLHGVLAVFPIGGVQLAGLPRGRKSGWSTAAN